MTSARSGVSTPLIQAALNGGRTKAEHRATPISIDELVRDAVDSVAAGAGAIHLHPRDPDGRECLDAAIVDDVVMRVRSACGVPVGVTTGAWIEPERDRRLAMVRAWHAPDYSSVNLAEPDSVSVMQALIGGGVGIEAGVASVEDVDLLAASRLGDQVTRILVEPYDVQTGGDAAAVLTLIDDIHQRLDSYGLKAPRLQHSDGSVTWIVVEDAIRRGLDTRIGLEDTLKAPNGEWTTSNAALVRAASAIRDGKRSKEA
jgi:uncharacterized protein (DUF849 family)